MQSCRNTSHRAITDEDATSESQCLAVNKLKKKEHISVMSHSTVLSIYHAIYIYIPIINTEITHYKANYHKIVDKKQIIYL